ncbi:hypothetical protein SLS64_003519 [Diaporthe eres]
MTAQQPPNGDIEDLTIPVDFVSGSTTQRQLITLHIEKPSLKGAPPRLPASYIFLGPGSSVELCSTSNPTRHGFARPARGAQATVRRLELTRTQGSLAPAGGEDGCVMLWTQWLAEMLVVGMVMALFHLVTTPDLLQRLQWRW